MALAVERTIVLPRIAHRTIVLPPALRTALMTRFQTTIVISDIDKTWLSKSDPHGSDSISYLSGAALNNTIDLVVGGLEGLIFCTGSMFSHQEKRTIVPIVQALKQRGKISLMDSNRVALSASRGGALGLYDEKGVLDQELFELYTALYGINREDLPELEKVCRGAIADYIARYHADPAGFHRKYPNNPKFHEPVLQNRDNAQLALIPFPSEERENIVDYIKDHLSAALWRRYKFLPGGSTTIDINRVVDEAHDIVVSKAMAIKFITLTAKMNRAEIKELLQATLSGDQTIISDLPMQIYEQPGANEPGVLYFGDEMHLVLNRDGSSSIGNDVSVLAVPSVQAFALNKRPESLVRSPRVTHIGFEHRGLQNLLSYASRHLGAIKVPDTLDTVFYEEGLAQVPEAVSSALSSGFAGAMVAVSGSLLTGHVMQKDIPDPAEVDPSIMEITKLLQKGIPVVLISGGDYKTRVVPIFNALYEALKTANNPEAIKHMAFYSNGGAIKAIYDENGNIDRQKMSDHINEHGIYPGDVSKITDVLEALIAEYKEKVEEEHPGLNIQMPQIDLRTSNAQVTLRPLEADLRGWAGQRFIELAEEAGLNGKYDMHMGGYAIDITRKGVDKGGSLVDALRHFGLPQNAPIIYFGGEFWHGLGEGDEIIRGIDMEVLRLRNLFALALNDNQENVPDFDRIFKAGSGTLALLAWLKYINKSLG